MTWAAAITRSTDLHALEAIVEKGKSTFIEVGMALLRIREARLYKATHSSWENYCQHRWGWSGRRGNQLAQAAQVIAELGEVGNRVPGEHAARHLASLPSVEHRKAAVELAVEEAGGALPTEPQVRRAAAHVAAVPAGQLGFGLPGAPRRDLSQWDTRPETAAWLVKWSRVKRGMRVLEPSAGKGNVARALRAAGAKVTCVEIDPARAAALAADGFTVHAGDFLEYSARLGPGKHFDMVVGNPPYEKDQDRRHVLAMLSLVPKIGLLARLVLLEGQKRGETLWAQNRLKRLCVLSERESFEGDIDGTARSAFAAFEIHRGPGKSIVEWR